MVLLPLFVACLHPVPPPAVATGDPGAVPILAWTPGEEGCEGILLDAANPTNRRTLARLPADCDPSWSVSPAPDGTRLAVSMGDAIFLVDAVKGRLVPLPPFPYDAAPPEIGGFDAGGDLTVVFRSRAASTQDDEAQRLWFQEGEEVWDARWDDVEYAADFALCHAWTLDGDEWTRGPSEVVTLNEGTSAPFCGQYSSAGQTFFDNVVIPGFRGGFGYFGYSPLDEGAGPSVEGVSQWAAVHDDPLYAAPLTWLEGAFINAPLMVRMDDDWRPVEGFDNPGELRLEWRDDHLLVCGDGETAVFVVATAERIWGMQGSCAMFWPLQ